MNIEETKHMDEKLYSTMFKTESEQIPDEILEPEELKLIKACRNQENITHDEMQELKGILYRYRKIIQEYDVSEIEENVEKTQKLIQTEQDLLNIIQQKEVDIPMKMKYDVRGEEYWLDLIIKPMDNETQLATMEDHLALFADFTTEERLLLDKSNRGEVLSPEETKMMEYINKKLLDVANSQTVEDEWDHLIASQVEFANGTLVEYEDKLKFWKNININTKAALYMKIRELLHLDETINDDLFLIG